MRVDTETKSFRFKENEKDFLYKTLQEPAKIKYNEFLKKFDVFLKKVIEDIYDPDLVWLSSRKYCRVVNNFRIDPVKLGLPEKYGDEKSKTYIEVAGNIRIGDLCFPIAKDTGNRFDLTSMLIDKCSPEILEQIKSSFLELAKLRYEYEYFGLGTFIRSGNRWYRSYFVEIDTWGQLYAKSQEYYKIVYDRFLGGSEVDEREEIRLLKKMKMILGK